MSHKLINVEDILVAPQILKTGANNHICTVATVSIGKRPPVPGGPQNHSGCLGEEKILLHWRMNSDYLAGNPYRSQ